MRSGAILGLATWTMVLSGAPAWADFRLDRQLTLAGGGTFVLETAVGSVTLTGDSISKASMLLTAQRDDFDRRFDIQIEDSAGVATVRVRRRGGWIAEFFPWSWLEARGVQFTIHVPRPTTVRVTTSGGSVHLSRLTGDTAIRTSGGRLDVQDIEGRVKLETSGGSISVQRVHGDVTSSTSGGAIGIGNVQGSVRADTSGGRVVIDTVTADVHARTSGGGVQVRGAGGRVEARSSGGSVSVGFAAGNGRGGELSSSGGGVRAEIDPAVALSVDASTSGGRVNTDVPVAVSGALTRHALRGDLNGGGPMLRMRSSGGGIRIVAATGSSGGR